MGNATNDKSLTNLCPSCFAETGQSETCPACGYRAGDSNDDWNRLKPGTTIHGRYIVGKILGQGGFGITYLGLDSLLGFKLAIKEYYPSGVAARNSTSRMVKSASSDARENFHRGMEKFLEEAKILARFEGQPNIVSVRDFFQENGTAYMVMTYLEGRTLLKYLDEKGGRISFSEAMETLSPVMDSLDEVHASGLIHRDISPDNIFVTHNGQVKLLDFGASKSALNLLQQKSHSVVLKRGYSPPEQYQSRGRLGPWTDVYGMAATLYRAVTGQVPPDSLDRLGDDTLMLNSQMEKNIPIEARAGLLQGLALSPKARPQSMREFKERLFGEFRHLNVSEVQRNDSNSLYELGMKYEMGNGVPKDLKKAAELYQIAADLGNTDAQNTLGKMYFFGYGVQQNYSKESEWFRKGAEQGHAGAQSNFGDMFRGGYGVQQDYRKALEWYHKSAEQGNSYAQNNLGAMHYYGFGVPQNYSKAVEWYRKGAEQGNPPAQYSLGWMYEHGQGVGQDYSKAFEWYCKSAEQGYSPAQNNLGSMYQHGLGVPQNKNKAREWYRKAAEEGHKKAAKNLKNL